MLAAYSEEIIYQVCPEIVSTGFLFGLFGLIFSEYWGNISLRPMNNDLRRFLFNYFDFSLGKLGMLTLRRHNF
jgi:hypothetical protein